MRKAVSGLLQHFGCLITEKHAYMQTYASAVCLLFNISSAFTRQLTETSASLVLLWESSNMGSVQDGAAISYDYAQQERKELWWRWAAKHLIC